MMQWLQVGKWSSLLDLQHGPTWHPSLQTGETWIWSIDCSVYKKLAGWTHCGLWSTALFPGGSQGKVVSLTCRVRWKFLRLVHFNTFIQDTESEIKSTPSKHRYDANPSGQVDNRSKGCHPEGPGSTWVGAAPDMRTHGAQSCRGELGVVVDEKLVMRQKCVPTTQTWAPPKEEWPVGQGRWFFPFTLMSTHLECCTQTWGSQHEKETDLLKGFQRKTMRMMRGMELKHLGPFSWRREGYRETI